MSFTSLSVIFAVLVSNIYMRGLHDPVPLPRYLKTLSTVLAKVMCMKLYHIPNQLQPAKTRSLVETIYTGDGSFRKIPLVNGTPRVCSSLLFVKNEKEVNTNQQNAFNLSQENTQKFQEAVLQTLQNLIDREDEKDREQNLRNQWQEAGTILDRFMFWIFLIGTMSGTLYLLIFLPMRKNVNLTL